jgi:hypothetical protein
LVGKIVSISSNGGLKWDSLRHLTVRIADKFVEVHPDFRLLLVTRNSAITLTPREASLVAVVNFTVTRVALRMQLLTLALSTEMPELEQQHQEQLNDSEQLKIELRKLDSPLLDILATADRNTILTNKELIQLLDTKKKRANEVEHRLKRSKSVRHSSKGSGHSINRSLFLHRPSTSRSTASSSST